MIARPALPDRTLNVAVAAQNAISGPHAWVILLPEAPILTDRNDRGAAPPVDSSMTTASLEGAIARHGADLLIQRDLLQVSK